MYASAPNSKPFSPHNSIPWPVWPNRVLDIRIDFYVNVIGFENMSLTVEVVSSVPTHSAFLKVLADLWFRINFEIMFEWLN